MKQTPVVFRIDQMDLHPVFCLAQLTVSNDSARIEKLIDLADEEDKTDSGYKANVALIESWAIPWPDDLQDEEGKKIKRPKDALDNPEAIKKFFAEPDANKDWIGEEVVRTMYELCRPKRTFLTASQQ